jgi:two-component system cell cycle sensor histidine kinase/response regulator CckA
MKSTLDPVHVGNRRILIIDDNPAIHEDFRKVLGPTTTALARELDAETAELFGAPDEPVEESSFQIDSAFQGEEGLEKIRAAAARKAPYAVAFVDVRMPPGWDGIETISRVWAEFPDLQVVICTAFSDYSWGEIAKAVGNSDQVLVLKKPFDNVEAMQMAHALTKKWHLTQIARRQFAELDALVNQRTAELRETYARLTGEVNERAAAEERFSKAFHGSPVPMAIQKADGASFLDINASFLELLGAQREAVLAGGASLWTDDAIAERITAQLAGRHAVRDLAATIVVAGVERHVLVAADNLEIYGASHRLLILQDMTERVRLEAELRQSQKMEAVGRLAAGVAHDFNNILTVILGNASLHAGNPMLEEKLSTSLQQVMLAAERAAALTRQLLAYSRKQIIRRQPLSLNEVVRKSAEMLRRIIGEHITLDLELADDLPSIFADSGNVDQVIMNLALNARDAMPEGGKITFKTSLCELDESHCANRPDSRAGRFGCFAVKDTGRGMDEAILSRLFEPFFTTKEQGKGTGMGLASVYGVLQQHDGWVEVESKVGCGATVSAFFPLSREEALAESAQPARALDSASPKGQVTILVVEDEDLLREFVSESLTALGYRILSAPNGREALEIWARRGAEINLLLTDIVMPESISGRHLAHTLVMDRPDLKVIFTSGYSPELFGSEFAQEKQHGFLAKPYLSAQLAQTVARKLQAD